MLKRVAWNFSAALIFLKAKKTLASSVERPYASKEGLGCLYCYNEITYTISLNAMLSKTITFGLKIKTKSNKQESIRRLRRIIQGVPKRLLVSSLCSIYERPTLLTMGQGDDCPGNAVFSVLVCSDQIALHRVHRTLRHDIFAFVND